MRTLTLFFFLLLALAGLPSAAAQTSADAGTITGRVTDADTGDPLLFCSLRLFQNKQFRQGGNTDINGYYTFFGVMPGTYSVEVAYTGYPTTITNDVVVAAGDTLRLDLTLDNSGGILLDEVVIIDYKEPIYEKDHTTSGSSITSSEIRNLPSRNINGLAATTAGISSTGSRPGNEKAAIRGSRSDASNHYIDGVRVQGKLIPETERHGNSDPTAGEQYNAIVENNFIQTWERATHTFSSDVDAASYSLLRSTLNANNLPEPNAVRIEEMINYFNYDLPAPTGEAPLAAHTELAPCPWNPAHRLLQIGMRARGLSTTTLPPANFVFLIDASGSMSQPNKLPLLIESFKLLVDNLSTDDRVAIVVYAGAAGMVLPPTSGGDKHGIRAALDRLRAGGSTAGGAGIELA
ncbi:MAG: von Willebrand factor type A domain-containing protein, partial [Saprospiraceae bacterium]